MGIRQGPVEQHWYGFILSLVTAFMWGVLPIFLKLTLTAMDPTTITWYRFFFAAVFVLIVLLFQRGLPQKRNFSGALFLLVLIAAIGLTANYVANVLGLVYINPETAQIIIQLAPFLLMLGGVIFYKETMSNMEKFGAVVLFSGLLLFFNENLLLLFSTGSEYSFGALIMLIAAFSWAVYALLQKILLRSYTAKQLTLLIYALGAAMLFPFVQLESLGSLSTPQLFSLLFCCVNTVVAYGAFTQALAVWKAAKVSAVIALTPIFTIGSMEFAVYYFPDYFTSSELNIWAYLGAGIVVVGSMLCALGKEKGEA